VTAQHIARHHQQLSQSAGICWTAIDNFGGPALLAWALCDMPIRPDKNWICASVARHRKRIERRNAWSDGPSAMCKELWNRCQSPKVLKLQAEFDVLRDAGITQFQGFYLGQPLLEGLRYRLTHPPPGASIALHHISALSVPHVAAGTNAGDHITISPVARVTTLASTQNDARKHIRSVNGIRNAAPKLTSGTTLETGADI